jgi:hypothetical protein
MELKTIGQKLSRLCLCRERFDRQQSRDYTADDQPYQTPEHIERWG